MHNEESSSLSHVNEKGQARMVDIGQKEVTQRRAIAKAKVRMQPATKQAIVENTTKKGDVLAVARVAGIMAAKQTASVIPMCHTLQLTEVTIDFQFVAEDELDIEVSCSCAEKTGVEMEALHAASVAALTIYDMCKAIDRFMTIEKIALQSKTGGKSGQWQRSDAQAT